MRRALVAVALVACSKSKPAELPPACTLATRVLDGYIACRRANPQSFPAQIIVDYQRDMTALWRKVVADHGAWKAARMCSFHIDSVRADMAGEDCGFALTDADRAIIADARVQVTPAPRASNAANQQIVDAYVVRREATCKCADKACVEAADRVGALPLEKLQVESDAVHDALDAISAETYDCATRTSILSPDRWQRVK